MEVIGDIGNIFWRLSEYSFQKVWNFDEIYRIRDTYREYIE